MLEEEIKKKLDSTFLASEKDCENCLKGQYGSNHIVLSPHLCFWKPGECWILKDIMVQSRDDKVHGVQMDNTVQKVNTRLQSQIFLF